MPGMPSTPTAVETGASFGSIFRQTLAVGERMGLPAGARQHDVAFGKTGIVRSDHLATVPPSITPPIGTGAA